MTNKIRVLELFSGMGGMHYALEEAKKFVDFEYTIVQAIDISDVANQVYKHNFPEVNVKGSNICGLTPETLTKMKIDAIFMSPPCQPFTRQGHQKDIQDARSQPFLHIVQELIPKVDGLNYILLENVKGFETSQAHKLLIESLKENRYKYQEFLLCPKQLGIPNARLRYYLIASRSDSFKQGSNLVTSPSEMDPEITEIFVRNQNSTLSNYLDLPNDPFDKAQLELSDTLLEKHAEVFDIVDPNASSSCCFTKSYGKYAEGTGSILYPMAYDNEALKEAFEKASKAKSSEEKLAILRSLKLRYFSPSEVALLMGFPKSIQFPPDYIKKPQLCFRVLGNSLNVTVVSMLTTLLFKTSLP